MADLLIELAVKRMTTFSTAERTARSTSIFQRESARGHGTDALVADLRATLGTCRADPTPLVAVLARHGELDRGVEPFDHGGYAYGPSWRAVFERLVLIGGIDLSLGRLLEGHLNAVELVALYGTHAQQARVLRVIEAGGLMGVWGADDTPPARVERTGDVVRLTGAKRYASGVGIVRLALVPVNRDGGGMDLLLLDVVDPARGDASGWTMRGMQRSVSGRYDFEGVPVAADDFVGSTDDYRREPHFVGGIWRCAAAQLGAIEAIVRLLIAELNATGRAEHPLQGQRIGEAILAARGARLFVEDAAERVRAASAASVAEIETAVALSAYARLAVEKAAMTVIDLAERGLGLASFSGGHPVDALSRDLAVYIRQANPDALLLQHGRVLAKGLYA